MGDATAGRMMSIVISVFASIFAINLLYAYTSLKGIWIAIVLIADEWAQIFQKTILAKGCFTRHEANDTDKVTLDQIITLIRLIISFVTVALALDVVKFLMAITHMVWYDYINIIVGALTFMLVLLARLKIV